MDKETWMRVQEALQALTPPLYEGKEIDGRPGQDTNTSVACLREADEPHAEGRHGSLRGARPRESGPPPANCCS